MEGNSHPIVDCKREIYPLYGNFRMSDVPLPAEVVYSGFRTNNMTVQVLSIAAVSTQCGGAMCDKQDLYRNGRMESKCSCISNIQRLCGTTIVMQLRLNNGGEEEMLINDFTSTWFMNNYMFKERLGAHIRASYFSDPDIEDELLSCTRKVMRYINDRGGFRIIGWAKRGMIQDQGATVQQDQGQQRYGQPTNQGNNMVENADVRLHIVRIDPTHPENIDLGELNDLKYNMGEPQSLGSG